MINVQKFKNSIFGFKKLLGLLCVCCTPCFAEDFYLAEFEQFGIDQSDFGHLSVTPVRLMDNETLFLAAAAERDNSMGVAQRLINNRWMASNSSNSFTGATALRKFCQVNLLSAFKNSRGEEQDKTIFGGKLKQGVHKVQSAFTNINNYDLSLSNDSIELTFAYGFH